VQFFTCEALEFLKELKQNNSKEWFLKNRDRYERLILDPSKLFVNEMGEHLLALDPHIKAIPKVNGSLFRIYRDIRLSKDKRPMKSRIGIIFYRGTKRLQSSSFYLHFSPDEFLVASGIRGFCKDNLEGYREFIKDEKNAKDLSLIFKKLQSKGFFFPEPKYKRYPRGFDKDSPYANLSLYSSMFAYKRLDPKEICLDNLESRLFDIYSQLLPIYEWVYKMSLSVEIDSNNAKSISLS
jgi:uncharacterized protein (TIGR02453 family)